MGKIKYENIIFLILAIGSIYNATLISQNGLLGVHSGFITCMYQLIIFNFIRLGFRYIRKNPQTVIKEIIELFKD